MVIMMKTMYDLRNVLKRYGIFIYTGNRLGDVDLMENEVRDLYKSNILPIAEYQTAMLLLRGERRNLSKKNENDV